MEQVMEEFRGPEPVQEIKNYQVDGSSDEDVHSHISEQLPNTD